jgi:hypothetical protein
VCDFTCVTITVILRVLLLIVVTTSEDTLNRLTDPNPVYKSLIQVTYKHTLHIYIYSHIHYIHTYIYSHVLHTHITYMHTWEPG